MNRYKAFEVTIFKSFTVVDGETLLKASERCLGHIIKVGCRGGGCGVCKVKVVKGDYETGKMSLKVCSLKERKNNIHMIDTSVVGSLLKVLALLLMIIHLLL